MTNPHGFNVLQYFNEGEHAALAEQQPLVLAIAHGALEAIREVWETSIVCHVGPYWCHDADRCGFMPMIEARRAGRTRRKNREVGYFFFHDGGVMPGLTYYHSCNANRYDNHKDGWGIDYTDPEFLTLIVENLELMVMEDWYPGKRMHRGHKCTCPRWHPK